MGSDTRSIARHVITAEGVSSNSAQIDLSPNHQGSQQSDPQRQPGEADQPTPARRGSRIGPCEGVLS